MIPIIEIDGIEEAQDLIQKLHALGSSIQSAEVNGRARKEDGRKNNAQVLRWLGENHKGGNRNFWEMTQAETDTIVIKPFVKKLMDSLNEMGNHPTKSSMKAAAVAKLGDVKKAAQWANQKMGNAMKAACNAYLRWVSANIENGNWKGSAGDLDSAYADLKKKRHGFTHPIGVATGQLLDNVAPSKKNIQINRSK